MYENPRYRPYGIGAFSRACHEDRKDVALALFDCGLVPTGPLVRDALRSKFYRLIEKALQISEEAKKWLVIDKDPYFEPEGESLLIDLFNEEHMDNIIRIFSSAICPNDIALIEKIGARLPPDVFPSKFNLNLYSLESLPSLETFRYLLERFKAPFGRGFFEELVELNSVPHLKSLLGTLEGNTQFYLSQPLSFEMVQELVWRGIVQKLPVAMLDKYSEEQWLQLTTLVDPKDLVREAAKKGYNRVVE